MKTLIFSKTINIEEIHEKNDLIVKDCDGALIGTVTRNNDRLYLNSQVVGDLSYTKKAVARKIIADGFMVYTLIGDRILLISLDDEKKDGDIDELEANKYNIYVTDTKNDIMGVIYNDPDHYWVFKPSMGEELFYDEHSLRRIISEVSNKFPTYSFKILEESDENWIDKER